MPTIHPLQIVYIEHQDARLYAEVIQTANDDRIWSRPLMIVEGLPSHSIGRQQAISEAAIDPNNSQLTLFDLEQSPDLVWPMAAFELALDTEFFSLMFHLKVNSNPSDSGEKAQAAFRHFLQGCWQPPRTVSG
ncbi:MAG: hypothetical protein AAFN18_24520 [Cyanobacteria bacterium J06554_6]